MIFRFDDGTTANDPACGAYDMAVLVDETFVVIDDVFVVMDCNTPVELTAIGAPDRTVRINKIEVERTLFV